MQMVLLTLVKDKFYILVSGIQWDPIKAVTHLYAKLPDGWACLLDFVEPLLNRQYYL